MPKVWSSRKQGWEEAYKGVHVSSMMNIASTGAWSRSRSWGQCNGGGLFWRTGTVALKVLLVFV